ncbi:hypothetical protein EYF80_067492 [Liparis tanakae]|uniref:Uncharacterized protein n=1 Tax=Liparis tanakae TaxID=230148 RepID=A0A4Z2E0Y4_9TELE|nr:hypothetical protein EYF80_067492 [Liparis tanakae]
MSSIAVHSLLHTPSSPPPTCSPPLSFPPASAITMETRPLSDGLKAGGEGEAKAPPPGSPRWRTLAVVSPREEDKE